MPLKSGPLPCLSQESPAPVFPALTLPATQPVPCRGGGPISSAAPGRSPWTPGPSASCPVACSCVSLQVRSSPSSPRGVLRGPLPLPFPGVPCRRGGGGGGGRGVSAGWDPGVEAPPLTVCATWPGSCGLSELSLFLDTWQGWAA